MAEKAAAEEAARLAEEQRLEQERIMAEKVAAEEAARLAGEQRLEQERIAAEKAAAEEVGSISISDLRFSFSFLITSTEQNLTYSFAVTHLFAGRQGCCGGGSNFGRK